MAMVAAPTDLAPAADLNVAVEAASELPRLRSLLISRRGTLVVERYFNGARATRLANIKSASKSVISALVGIAIDRGLIASVNVPLATYFPDILRGEPRKGQITIEDLLTMRSGLEGTSNRNYGAWVLSPNWVRHALTRPLVAEPGSAMEYSTGNTHLLSAILTRSSGKSTWRFAQDVLAQPLGFTLAQWPRDPQGVFFGGNDMLMTPRQMLAFGELYLHAGRVAGRQVVPAAWVSASLTPRARSRWSDQEYGYGWWLREMGGRQVYFAWGFGGQYIFIVPTLDLVVVTTSATDVSEERRAHRRTIFDVLEQVMTSAAASP